MSLLEQNIIKEEEIKKDKSTIKLNANDKNKEYKVEVIWNSIVYTNKSAKNNLSEFYYLIS